MEEIISPNQPIPLIEIEGNESLKANPEALDLLRTIDPEHKVCVVCVCGIYRSGKSSLMNWLLGVNTWSKDSESVNKGFTVGPSVNRCTRGTLIDFFQHHTFLISLLPLLLNLSMYFISLIYNFGWSLMTRDLDVGSSSSWKTPIRRGL